jgi:hypothetical protein
VSQALADIYVGLATDQLQLAAANSDAAATAATDYLLAAVTVRPSSAVVRNLSAATTLYLSAAADERSSYVAAFAEAYAAYAEERSGDQATCVAANAIAAAMRLTPNAIAPELVTTYGAACQGLIANSTTTPASSTGGVIYYSSQDSSQGNSTYRIWRVPADLPGAAEQVVKDASQPSLWNTQLAFYSRHQGSEGLSGVDLSTAFDPNGQFPRYTEAVEDGRESPASWRPNGQELVLASVDGGDRKSRIYTVNAVYNSMNQKVYQRFGEDPAWSPDGSAIVYRDAGTAGNSVGLMLMPAAGGSAISLTTGDDRRPAWTPDGKQIVFMRRVDGFNWELFRLTLETKAVVQLTNDPAQDGLPALNPTGDRIVFASDRGGIWQLWTIGLAESELASSEVSNTAAQLLMPIEGTFLQWLEHSIQWVN